MIYSADDLLWSDGLEDLRTLLDSKPLEPDQPMPTKMRSGLHEVHDMNVEMRDLKPVTSLHGLLMCRLDLWSCHVYNLSFKVRRH